MSREKELRQGTRRYHAALMVLAVSLMSQAANAKASNGWNIDGEHGRIYVHGLLLEGACRLNMTSAWQDVEMASMTTAQLPSPGAEGTPVPITLYLKDCIRTRGDSLDSWIGTHTWDGIQPVMTVTFLAPADPDSPSLLKVTGTSGMALRVTDSAHRVIRPGERSTPQFTTPSSDQLTYIITPVRTAATFLPGKYHAVLNFGLNYD